ncbi:MAG TPA: hypothetical protein PLO56_12630 [Rhodothermales bacterium]|nr:hypothetical protein [Rhodothermales bacterium]
MNRWMYRLGGLLSLLFLLTSSGCDPVGPTDTVTLTANKEFFFTFASGDGQTKTRSLTSDNKIDITDVLTAQNFTKAALSSGTLDSAVLEVIFPTGIPVSFLKTVTLSFSAPGLSTLVVATQTNFPSGANDDTVTLSIDALKDITPFLREDSFSGNLNLTANSLLLNREYELNVRLKLLARVNF